jgi:two-component system, NarL family, response regulator LiaR
MIKIAIIDNLRLLTDTLNLVLNWEPDLKLVWATSDISNAYTLLESQSPDVILLEIHISDSDGYDLVSHIQDQFPKTKIIILTSTVNDTLIVRAIKQNVHGILSKRCSLSELISAIRAAANGDIAIASNILVGVIRRQTIKTKFVREREYLWEKLTDREKDVLNCLALGKSGNMIAKELNITPLTVRTHVRNLMTKLGVHSRLEAVSFAICTGIIKVPTDGILPISQANYVDV